MFACLATHSQSKLLSVQGITVISLQTFEVASDWERKKGETMHQCRTGKSHGVPNVFSPPYLMVCHPLILPLSGLETYQLTPLTGKVIG